MVDTSKCPTCGRRYHAGRENGGAADLCNRLATELQKDILDPERVKLLVAESELRIACIVNSRDKRKARKKGIQYRKKRPLAEKVKRGRVREIPIKQWSITPEQREKILARYPNDVEVPKPEEVAEEESNEALANFFPSLKEEKQ